MILFLKVSFENSKRKKGLVASRGNLHLLVTPSFLVNLYFRYVSAKSFKMFKSAIKYIIGFIVIQ